MAVQIQDVIDGMDVQVQKVMNNKQTSSIVSAAIAQFRERFVAYKARMVTNPCLGSTFGVWFLCLDDEVAHYEDGFRRVVHEWMRYLSDLRAALSADSSSGGGISPKMNTRKRTRRPTGD